MAEPVGITGTAAGLVSLGLQLHGEISKYIDAVKGRRRELDAAKRNADTLQKCLTAIDEIIGPVTAQSTASEAVETCRLSCEDEINALKSLVERLRGPLTPTDTLSAKFKERHRQLTYPFHRNDVLELEKRLASTNDRLQTALHTLELNMSRNIQDLVTTLHSDVQVVRLETESSSATLARVANTVENSSSRLEQLIPEIHTQTTRTSLMVAQQAQNLSQTTQVSVRLEETAQQTQTRFDRTDEVLMQLVKGQQEMNQQMLQLIARPSQLGSLCDQFAMERPADLARPGGAAYLQRKRADFSYGSCPCTRRRKIQRNRRNFGPLFLETEFSETTHHSPHCPLSRIKVPEQQRKRGFGFTIPAVQNILEHAIRVSMSLNTGAGGLSLSQSLSWVATVDSKRSPAFRLLHLVSMAISGSSNSTTPDRSLQVVESCVRRLAWCYEQKVAAPADVDEKGQNVLSTVVSIGYMEFGHGIVFARLVRRLLELNVPVNAGMGRYRNNQSILSYIIVYRRNDHAAEAGYELSRALASSGAESEQLVHNSYPHIRVFDAFRVLKKFPEYAEMVNAGPLTMAILRQDAIAVRYLLERFPSSVWDRDSDGLTAVHVAVLVANTQVLGLVLRSSPVELVNTVDLSDRYPIDYATMDQQHPACQTSNDQDCNGCVIVEALLRSGSALSASSLQLALGLDMPFGGNHSQAAKRIILRHLKARRAELQDLATAKLRHRDCLELDISSLRVLDRHAIQAQRLLEAALGKISPELIVFDGNESFGDFEQPKTVYAHISDRKTAQYAWDLGFHDVGCDAANGFYQVVEFVYGSYRLRVVRQVLAHVSWLVNHGMKLEAVVEHPDAEDSRPTYAHYVMAFLGNSIEHNSFLRLTMSPEVSDAVFSESVKDSCLCGCASGGCSPLTKFLRPSRPNYLGHIKKGYNGYESPWEMCQSILGMITRKQRSSDQYSWIYRGILRYFTFAALGLRHTCCNEFLRRKWAMDDENVEEIRKEEEGGLLLLETLVTEFEVECGCNSNLVQFLQEYWEPRMKQVREDIDGRRLTTLERHTAKELGVLWGPDDYEDWDRSSVSSCSSEESEEEIETERYDVMKVMDDIAPDPMFGF